MREELPTSKDQPIPNQSSAVWFFQMKVGSGNQFLPYCLDEKYSWCAENEEVGREEKAAEGKEYKLPVIFDTDVWIPSFTPDPKPHIAALT
jgi:hypothetical protein